jgi:head-tail adaptor
LKPRWQKVCGCFARVDGAKASGPEPVIADGTRSVRDYVFWVQADLIGRHCITVVDRLRWKGRVFDIADIPDQQLRGRLMTVIARTGANAG